MPAARLFDNKQDEKLFNICFRMKISCGYPSEIKKINEASELKFHLNYKNPAKIIFEIKNLS
jgi:hypothetical protein